MVKSSILPLMGFIFTVICTGVAVLWYISAEFNSLEIQDTHVRQSIVIVQGHLLSLDNEVKPVPLNSQLILNVRSELATDESKIGRLNSQLLILDHSRESYVDKEYFYRDMGIIKNDFRTTNSKVYVNTREINYLRGKFNVNNLESE